MSGFEIAGLVLGAIPIVSELFRSFSFVDLDLEEIARLLSSQQNQLVRTLKILMPSPAPEIGMLQFGQTGHVAAVLDALDEPVKGTLLHLLHQILQLLDNLQTNLTRIHSLKSSFSKRLRLSAKRDQMRRQVEDLTALNRQLAALAASFAVHPVPAPAAGVTLHSTTKRLHRTLAARQKARDLEGFAAQVMDVAPIGTECLLFTSSLTFDAEDPTASLLLTRTARIGEANHVFLEVGLGQGLLAPKFSSSLEDYTMSEKRSQVDSIGMYPDSSSAATSLIESRLPETSRGTLEELLASLWKGPTEEDTAKTGFFTTKGTMSIRGTSTFPVPTEILPFQTLTSITKLSPQGQLALCLILAESVFALDGSGLLPDHGFTSTDVFFLLDPYGERAFLDGTLLRVSGPKSDANHRFDSQAPGPFRFQMLGKLLVEILLRTSSSDLSKSVETPDARRGQLEPVGSPSHSDALVSISLEYGDTVADVISYCFSPRPSEDGNREVNGVDAFHQRILKPFRDVYSAITSDTEPLPRTKLLNSWDRSRQPLAQAIPPVEVVLPGGFKEYSQLSTVYRYLLIVLAASQSEPWLHEAIHREVFSFQAILQEATESSKQTVLARDISTGSDDAQFCELRDSINKCLSSLEDMRDVNKLPYGEVFTKLENTKLQLRVATVQLSTILEETPTPPPSPTLTSDTLLTAGDSMVFSGAGTSITGATAPEAEDLIELDVTAQLERQEIIRRFLNSLFKADIQSALSRQRNFTEIAPRLSFLLDGYLHALNTDCKTESAFRDLNEKAEQLMFRNRDLIMMQMLNLVEGKPTEPLTGSSDGVGLIPVLVVEDFILGGKAFGRLRCGLRKLAGQDIMDIIQSEVLLSFPFISSTGYEAWFDVEWELAQYVKEELPSGSDKIGRVFTVTGGNVDGFATACEDYLSQFWHDLPYNMCSHIQEYLARNEYEHVTGTLSIRESETSSGEKVATVSVTETKLRIVQIAQQLAWLTAVFRCPSSSAKPSLSEINFFATRDNMFVIETNKLQDVQEEDGTCWHTLVGGVSIARGFPIPKRVGVNGLEIPLPLMHALGHVNYSLRVRDHLALCGFSTLLYPKLVVGDFVQWHFERAESPGTYLDASEHLQKSNWNRGNSEEDKETWRHFVGYCQSAQICLAGRGCNFSSIMVSGLGAGTWNLGVRMKTITVGFSLFGAAANTGVEWIMPKSTSFHIELDDYDAIIDHTTLTSVIVWDHGIKCGWLVPMHVAMLHMALMYIEERKQRQEEPLEQIVLPDGENNGSFVREVTKVLKDQGRTKLRKKSGEEEEYFMLKDLIKRIWNDISGCMAARNTFRSEDSGTLRHNADCIVGWEMRDFVERPPLEFLMKRSPLAPAGITSGWEKLAADRNMLVLICEKAGVIIKPSNPSGLCPDWQTPPPNRNYLIASLACLENLGRRYGDGIRIPHTKIGDGLFWSGPPATAALLEECSHTPSTLCARKLQKLRDVGDDTGSHDIHNGRIQLPREGAVIFGSVKLQRSQPGPSTPVVIVQPGPDQQDEEGGGDGPGREPSPKRRGATWQKSKKRLKEGFGRLFSGVAPRRAANERLTVESGRSSGSSSATTSASQGAAESSSSLRPRL